MADSLVQRGQASEADELVSMQKQKDFAGIKRMMTSNPVIEQIMQNQALMRSTYTLRRNKIMEPKEAVWGVL